MIYPVLIKNFFRRTMKKIFWMLKLNKKGISKKGLNITFPVVVEGNGNIVIGDNATLSKNAMLVCGPSGTINIQQNSRIGFQARLQVVENSELVAGNNFQLHDNAFLLVVGKWSIGDNVAIAPNCQVFSRERGFYGVLKMEDGTCLGDYGMVDVSDNVTICKNAGIGPRVTIYTHDHDYASNRDVPWMGKPKTKPVVIGEGVWVGSNVTILPGVVVGKGAVIAAGSVVTKNVEPYTLVGGIPAKMIKQL